MSSIFHNENSTCRSPSLGLLRSSERNLSSEYRRSGFNQIGSDFTDQFAEWAVSCLTHWNWRDCSLSLFGHDDKGGQTPCLCLNTWDCSIPYSVLHAVFVQFLFSRSSKSVFWSSSKTFFNVLKGGLWALGTCSFDIFAREVVVSWLYRTNFRDNSVTVILLLCVG